MKRSIGFLIAACLLLGLTACSGSAAAAVAQPTTEPALPAVKAPIEIIAEARVVPAQDAALTFASGGMVKEVLVNDGDTVQAGQVIARLSGGEAMQAALETAELDVLSAQQALNTLQSDWQLQRAQAQVDVTSARKAVDDATKRAASREYRHGSEDQIAVARAHYVMAEEGVENATIFYDQFDHLGEEDPNRAEALSLLAKAKQERDRALANLNWLMALPNPMDVERVEAELALAQAQLAAAETRLSKLDTGPDADAVALAQARLAQAQAALQSAQSSLANLELRAPFAGTINGLELVSGESVQPGAAVATLYDATQWYVDTIDLTERNVAQLQNGQPAIVRFDALPGFETIARVQKIDIFGQNRQGDTVYTVTLLLEQSDPRLRWNMSAVVTFLTQDE